MRATAFDGDALSGWVADDFLGNDNRGEFRGGEGDADPDFTAGHYGQLNAGAVSDAEYDPARLPDPLTVTCCLTAHDGRVLRLIIIHNEATLAWAPR